MKSCENVIGFLDEDRLKFVKEPSEYPRPHQGLYITRREEQEKRTRGLANERSELWYARIKLYATVLFSNSVNGVI